MQLKKRSWLVLAFLAAPVAFAAAQEKPEKLEKTEKPETPADKQPEFPTFEETSKDFEKVDSSIEGTSF